MTRQPSHLVCLKYWVRTTQGFSGKRYNMTSRIVQTMIEPTVVTVLSVRTDIFSTSSRAVPTPTTLATKTTVVTASSTAMAAATNFPASLPTSAGYPPLSSAFDSPLAAGEVHTPTIAVVALIMVVICALTLLLALCYFIILRLRGKCPNCPQYEDELKKWKDGDLKPIVPATVRQRMRAWDEEKGGMGLQVQVHKDRMRQQSLACLEGRVQDNPTHDNQTLDGHTLWGRAYSGWSSEATLDEGEQARDFDQEEGKTEQYPQIGASLQEPIPAHLVAAAAQLDPDEEETLVDPAYRNPDFAKSYSTYLRDVVTPREEFRKRELEEAKAQNSARYLKFFSDSNTWDSVKVRTTTEANDMMARRDVKEGDVKENITAPRQEGGSRFKEHLSWKTNTSYKAIG